MKVLELGARTCGQCGLPATARSIKTDLDGVMAVVIALCLCDARICQACKDYTANPKARRCVHCRAVF